MKRTTRPWLIAGATLGLAACNGGNSASTNSAGAEVAKSATDTGVSAADASATNPLIAADRPILDWLGQSAVDHNKSIIPSTFQQPDQHACAVDDSRQYIGEIFANGISKIEVDYHWAPILPGPNPAKKTLNQPEYHVAGELLHAVNGTDDVLADHPFGVDFNADLSLDAPYQFFSGIEHEGEQGFGELHIEYEQRITPAKDLDYAPAAGDRALYSGVWIFDCGHPPYGTEMHPPTFVANARVADALTTVGAVFALPYRSSLWFNPDVNLAVDLTNTARFDDSLTQTFPHALITAVIQGLTNAAPYITSHALMVGNHFAPLDFLACAPLPRPKDAKLAASWQMNSRTGVTVTATPDDANGCVHFHAEMAQDYQPFPLPYADVAWSWEQLSNSAGGQLGQSVDVRQEIIKLAKGMGLNTDVPALQPDHPPHVDGYVALHPGSGANLDSPTKIALHADDQPYPFYGRFRVAWTIPVK